MVKGPIGPRGPPGQRGSPGPQGLPGPTGPSLSSTLYNGEIESDVKGFFPNLVSPFVSSFNNGTLYLAGPNLFTVNTSTYNGNFPVSEASTINTNYTLFQELFGTNMNGTAVTLDSFNNLNYFPLPINPLGMLVSTNSIYFVGYDLTNNYWFYQTDLNFNFYGAYPILDSSPSYPVVGPVSLVESNNQVLFPSNQNFLIYDISSGGVTTIPTSVQYTFPQFYYTEPTAYLITSTPSLVNQLLLLNISSSQITTYSLPGPVTTFGLLGNTAFIAGTFDTFVIYNNGTLTSLTNPAPSDQQLYISPLIFDQSLPQGYYASSSSRLISIQTFSTTNFSQPIVKNIIDYTDSNPPSAMLQDDSGTLHIPYYGTYHYFNNGIDERIPLLLDSTHISGNVFYNLQYDPGNHRMLTASYYPSYVSQAISAYSDQSPLLINTFNIGYNPAQILVNNSNFYFVDQTSANLGIINTSNLEATDVPLPFLLYNYLINPINNYHGSAISPEGYVFVPVAGCTNFNFFNGTGDDVGYINVVNPENNVNTLYLPKQPQSQSAVTVSPVTQRVYFEYGDAKGSFVGYSDPPYTSYSSISTPYPSYGLFYVQTVSGNDLIYDLIAPSNQPEVQQIVGSALGSTISLPGANVTNFANVVVLPEETAVNFGNINLIGETNLNIYPTSPIAGVTGILFALVGSNLIAIQGTTVIYNLSLNTNVLSVASDTTGFYVGNNLQVSQYNLNGVLIKNWNVPQAYNNNPVYQIGFTNNFVAVTLPSNVPGQTNESYSVVLLTTEPDNTVEGSNSSSVQSQIFLITVPADTTFISTSTLSIKFVFLNAFPNFVNIVSVASLTPFNGMTFDQVTASIEESNLLIEGIVNDNQDVTLTTTTVFTFLVSYD